MTHVGPRVERLDEARKVRRGLVPPEALHPILHPDLEALSGDRLDVFDHGAPALVALDELCADVRDLADAHAQHHEIEIFRNPQPLLRLVASVPERFEFPSLIAEPVAAL